MDLLTSKLPMAVVPLTMRVRANAKFADLTIVVPTLNEGLNVLPFLQETERVLPGARVLFADDDSADDTRERALSFGGALDVDVLHRVDAGSDRGLTASVADALLRVKTTHVVVMDADLQHPLDAVPDVLTALQGGAQLVIATRKDDGSFSFGRRLASRVARGLAGFHLRRRVGMWPRDPMSGFFGGEVETLAAIVRANGAKFERAGFKVLMDLMLHAPGPLETVEVEYVFRARHAGHSKLAHHHYISFLRQLGRSGRLLAGFLDLLISGILLRFLLVGATGVGVNLFTLFGLHEGAGISLALAAPAAVEMSVLWNFAWNESWTFRGRDTATSVGTRLFQFHVASAAGMVLQLAVIAAGVYAFPHVHYFIPSMLGIIVGSGVNFVMNLQWTWGVKVDDPMESAE